MGIVSNAVITLSGKQLFFCSACGAGRLGSAGGKTTELAVEQTELKTKRRPLEYAMAFGQVKALRTRFALGTRGARNCFCPMPNPARRGLLCVFAVVTVGCLAPTLPLPPPGEPTISGPDEVGQVRLAGRVPRGSWVTAINRNTDLGYIQAAPEGSYDFEIRASVGDAIVLWYELDGEDSLPLEFEIP